MSVRSFTDRKIDPAWIPDRKPPSQFILMSGCHAWEMASAAEAYLGLAPCPVCSGRALAGIRYCLACDACGLDGRCTYPGLPVGKYLDPEWKAEATRYDPGDDLAGGVEGARVKVRRGIKRARKRAG